jgi:hypothetical protein
MTPNVLKSHGDKSGLRRSGNQVMPHPPVLRGIRLVQEALKAQGHEIIDFEVPDAAEAERLSVLTVSIPSFFYLVLRD